MRLFTDAEGQPKGAKSFAYGYSTAILMLAHADTSVGRGGQNVCAHSTPACRAMCIGEQGRARFSDDVRSARVRRTAEFFVDRLGFMDRMVADLTSHVAKSKRDRYKPCARPNGTSDLIWEKIRDRHGLTLMERFPKVQFYDYTAYNLMTSRKDRPENYYLTFSRKEDTPDSVVLAHIAAGFNVAVPFNVPRSKPLPKTYLGIRVIDGDVHDLRFKDPRGVIVGLHAKGKSGRDESGFVVRTEGA